MIFFKLLSSEDAIITLIFQKSILAQYFTTSLKISKATNWLKLSLKSRGNPNHEAHARYRSSRKGSKRLDIGLIPKYGKTQKRFFLLTSENVAISTHVANNSIKTLQW